MRTWRATVALGLTALALAGCAGTVPDPVSRTDGPVPIDPSNDPNVITDVGTPRDRARAHTNLAAAYFEAGNMGVALEEIRIALAADANFASAHNVQALIYMDLRENAQAEASFQRALRIAPGDPDTNHNYGWFLCQTGREAQGVKYFLTAVRNPLYTTPEKSYLYAGLCSIRRNDDTEAVDSLERALRLQPNYLEAMLPLAQVRYRRGELDAARALVTRFNRMVEPSAESLWLSLRIERKIGDKAAESGYADQLRRRFPGSREFQSLQKGAYE